MGSGAFGFLSFSGVCAKNVCKIEMRSRDLPLLRFERQMQDSEQ